MAALALAAVGGTRRETSVALAAVFSVLVFCRCFVFVPVLPGRERFVWRPTYQIILSQLNFDAN